MYTNFHLALKSASLLSRVLRLMLVASCVSCFVPQAQAQGAITLESQGDSRANLIQAPNQRFVSPQGVKPLQAQCPPAAAPARNLVVHAQVTRESLDVLLAEENQRHADAIRELQRLHRQFE